jgi:hypothetical protein
VLLVRIAADPIARAWSGVGDLALAADDIETTGGAIYKGVGRLADIPLMECLLNGEAGRLTLGVSGVDAVIQDMAEDALADVALAPVQLGLMFLDEREQPVSAPLWIVADGELEDIETARDFGSRTVAMTVGYGDLDRRRPQLSYWSPGDQERRSPGDLFCSRTPLYSEGTEVTWPRW